MDHQKVFKRDKFPSIHSKPIQYNGDGSGRDSYIKSDNGGLGTGKTRFGEYRMAFVHSLRSYDKIPYYLERRNYG